MIAFLSANKTFDSCCAITGGTLPDNDFGFCHMSTNAGDRRSVRLVLNTEEPKEPFFDSGLLSRILQVHPEDSARRIVSSSFSFSARLAFQTSFLAFFTPLVSPDLPIPSRSAHDPSRPSSPSPPRASANGAAPHRRRRHLNPPIHRPAADTRTAATAAAPPPGGGGRGGYGAYSGRSRSVLSR